MIWISFVRRNLNRFRFDRKGSAFAVAAFLFAIVFFAVLWYFMYSEDGFVYLVKAASSTIHTQLGTTDHALYDSSVSFIEAIMEWILILVLLGLFIAGIVYTHHKRGEMYA